MSLDEAQKQHVAQWLADGAKLAEIQNRIADEFDISLTYMDVRFLVDDLGVQLKDPEPEPKPKAEEETTAEPNQPEELHTQTPEDSDPSNEKLENQPSGSVSVSLDQITRPGSIISGKATFSDGKTAEWMIDQLGRLGLVPAEEGYKPSESDMMSFQMEIQKAIQGSGMGGF